MLRRLAGVALGLVAALTAGALAQTPTFRSGVDLVTVDVTAIDRGGRPIPDLTADQVQLLVDGQPRRVVAVQFVGRLAASPSASAKRAAPVPIPDHFTSNEYGDGGRLVVVAVDQQNIRPLEGTRALRAAARFLEALDPADRVGVASLTHLGPIEFTRDRLLAKGRLERLVGEADPVFLQFNIGLAEALSSGEGNRTALTDLIRRECGQFPNRPVDPSRFSDNPEGRDPCPEQIEQEARAIAQHTRTTTTTSMAALRRVVDSLREFEGPKTVVLLSEGLVAEPQYIDFTDLTAAARDARVTVYVLQLDVPLADAAEARPSPTRSYDRQLRADGLARVAGAARGTVFQLVGSDPGPFNRIAMELSGYYLVAFEARDSDRDGRDHRIRVALKRKAAAVRTRPTFRIARSPSAARPVEDQLVALLRTSTPVTELPLRVATFMLREPGGDNVRAIVSAEADAARGASSVNLGFVVRDEHDVIVASGAEPTTTGGFAFSAVVAPGDYKLTVGGIDGLGRRGTVERPFAARLTPRAVPVSDLILARVPQPANAPLHPIVDRATGDRVLAYIELYPSDGGTSQQAAVKVEVARTAEGPALVTVPATIRTVEGGLTIARAIVPLRDLAPGRYVARAAVVENGKTVSTLTRGFSVPGP